MARWACVDVPALPLQLLLAREPAWRAHPAVVVDEDKPQGTILWLNERARKRRIRPGMRYAAGLSLAGDLRAGVVAAPETAAGGRDIARVLREASPDVEPHAEDPGVFWLDAVGLGGLYPSLDAWAEGVLARLRDAGWVASLTVGFDRFATYALARTTRGVAVYDSAAAERAASDRVPLVRLQLPPKLCDAFERLGVTDVGGLRQLSAPGLLERFGKASFTLHRLADGKAHAPLAPVYEEPPLVERLELEPDQHELDVTGLLFLLKQRLGVMRHELARRGAAVRALDLELLLDAAPSMMGSVRPAAPTLDEVQLIDLLRLKIESLEPEAAIVGFELSVESTPASPEQLELFAAAQRRDFAAANRALARLRAELGDAAVVCAEMRDGHLPEAQFRWRPLERLVPAEPSADPAPRLVRRVLARPVALAHQRPDPDGWFVAGLGCGPVQSLSGPYSISGGWWRREVRREYYFAETREGDVLWVYFDRRRRRWFLQGVVE